MPLFNAVIHKRFDLRVLVKFPVFTKASHYGTKHSIGIAGRIY